MNVMETALKAVEVTGTVDGAGRITLDEALLNVRPGRVRVIVLFPPDSGADLDERQWLHAAVVNPAFDFLQDPAEDVYTLRDGRPFHDKG